MSKFERKWRKEKKQETFLSNIDLPTLFEKPLILIRFVSGR